MIIISPETFKDAFLKALPSKESQIVSTWNSPKSRTEAMKDLLVEIAIILCLQLYKNDYYTIDAIFYKEKDITYFSEKNTYAKYIAIAIEHENVLNGTQVVINKLQILIAPLKVLITYAEGDTVKKFLTMYANIIADSDVFSDISIKRKQLVIFGSYDGEKTDWSFHVYNDKAFQTI